QPVRRPAEKPVALSGGDAVLGEHAAQVPDSRVGTCCPAEQRGEIRHKAGDARPIHLESQIAPRAGFDRSEIVVRYIEAADDDPAAIGEGQLLVVAKQIAAPEFGAEATKTAIGVDQRLEEVPARRIAAEPVDQHRYADAAFHGPYQRIAYARTCCVAEKDIIENPQRLSRAVDERDERIEPLWP